MFSCHQSAFFKLRRGALDMVFGVLTGEPARELLEAGRELDGRAETKRRFQFSIANACDGWKRFAR